MPSTTHAVGDLTRRNESQLHKYESYAQCATQPSLTSLAPLVIHADEGIYPRSSHLWRICHHELGFLVEKYGFMVVLGHVAELTTRCGALAL